MTQRLRKLLFWTHLTAGVIAGVVILVMSVTGTLLTFQQSVLRIIEREQRLVVPPPGAVRLDADALLARVRAWAPDAQPTTLTFESDPAASAAVALGTQGMAFVNPYTGDVLGTGSARARAFYRSVTSWHRYLNVEGERRVTARAVTGACNAAFLVLAVTGLFIWWPKQWSVRHLAAITIFRRGLRGKARDFNWHNTIGFWSAPVLIVLTATGMVISYAWASNLVYTLTGSPRPAAAAGRAGGAGGGAAAANQGGRVDRGDERRETRTVPLATLVARAERELPTWRTMIIRLPARSNGPVSFSMSDREHWNSFARSTLTLDSATVPGPGDDVSRVKVVRWEPYAASSPGQKLRGWMRFAHTGELGGLTGEAVAGLASLGGAFLVYTGVALALRRLAAWRRRRAPVREMETPDARVA
jgi:uncharacterized iron-regulated membrane protein